MKKVFFIIALFSGLTGCASIVNGTQQRVSVSNGQVGGAVCSLSNSKGRWYINNTPGTVIVTRSFDNLHINCKKRGYKNGYRSIVSRTKPLVFGNAIFGGPIGAGLDMADGAAYDYPTHIFVPLHRA